jgi:hypothetical protein
MKYHIDEDRDTREVASMLLIANELAEANRLKRLEMELELLDEDEKTDSVGILLRIRNEESK